MSRSYSSPPNISISNPNKGLKILTKVPEEYRASFDMLSTLNLPRLDSNQEPTVLNFTSANPYPAIPISIMQKIYSDPEYSQRLTKYAYGFESLGDKELIEEIKRYFVEKHDVKFVEETEEVKETEEAKQRQICIGTGILKSISDILSQLSNENLECDYSIKKDQDYALLVCPTFGMYTSILERLGIKFSLFHTTEKDQYKINLAELDQAIGDSEIKPKVMILCYPNNPLGIEMDQETAEGIIKIAHKYNILVISDEVYIENKLDDKYPQKHFCLASAQTQDAKGNKIDPLRHCIVISSLAKAVGLADFSINIIIGGDFKVRYKDNDHKKDKSFLCQIFYDSAGKGRSKAPQFILQKLMKFLVEGSICDVSIFRSDIEGIAISEDKIEITDDSHNSQVIIKNINYLDLIRKIYNRNLDMVREAIDDLSEKFSILVFGQEQVTKYRSEHDDQNPIQIALLQNRIPPYSNVVLLDFSALNPDNLKCLSSKLNIDVKCDPQLFTGHDISLWFNERLNISLVPGECSFLSPESMTVRITLGHEKEMFKKLRKVINEKFEEIIQFGNHDPEDSRGRKISRTPEIESSQEKKIIPRNQKDKTIDLDKVKYEFERLSKSLPVLARSELHKSISCDDISMLDPSPAPSPIESREYSINRKENNDINPKKYGNGSSLRRVDNSLNFSKKSESEVRGRSCSLKRDSYVQAVRKNLAEQKKSSSSANKKLGRS